jgi:hypothetical protein
MRRALLGIALAMLASFAGATSYFVSASGSGTTCTQAAPCTFNTMITGAGPVAAGDTVYVRGGTYTANNSSPNYGWIASLAGTATSPIIIKAYPGERPIFDSNFSPGTANAVSPVLVDAPAKYLWFVNLEFTNSNSSTSGGTSRLLAAASGLWFNTLTVLSPGIKIINCIFHDEPGQGIAMWDNGVEVEIYGTILYYNGRETNQNHNIYSSSTVLTTHTKLFRDNISFNSGSLNYQIYGRSDLHGVSYITFEGNVAWRSGSLSGLVEYNMLFGTDDESGACSPCRAWGEGGGSHARFANNYTYEPSGADAAGYTNFSLGYNPGPGIEVQIVGNYGVGGRVIFFRTLERAGTTMTGNEFWGTTTNPTGTVPTAVIWPGNTFNNNTTRPTVNVVRYRPNVYEYGRGTIIVYNWHNDTTVAVDLSLAGVKSGDDYAITWVPNFHYGSGVTTCNTGTYAGGTVNINMTTLGAMPAPVAYSTPASVAPEFGVFIVTTTARHS